MFRAIRRLLDGFATQRFLDRNPDWFDAHTYPEIEHAFASHPVWNRVSVDVRKELSMRLASAGDHFKSFDAAHAFTVVAGMAHLFQVLHYNILPFDKDRSLSVEDKLFLIAETFRKIGTKGINQVTQAGDGIDRQVAVDVQTNSIMCLEAAICVDHYRIDTMPLMAMMWVRRSQDIAKANQIMAETQDLRLLLATLPFHAVGSFDLAMSEDHELLDEGIRSAREYIDYFCTGV